MTLRWYTVVVDCHDPAAQAAWWRETLDWQQVYEADGEVVIVPPHLLDPAIADVPWTQQNPGLVFVRVPEHKTLKNRLHIDLAPHTSDDRDAEIARLLALGARHADVGQTGDESWTVLADPEGNEFCVVRPKTTLVG